jgi:hypothetical protein
VNDGLHTAQKDITINLLNINDNIPTIEVNSTFNVNEGSLYIGSVSFSDGDGDNLTYSLSGTDASNFNINTDTNTLEFKIIPDYETQKHTYDITLNVNDGLHTAQKDIIINLLNINDNIPTIEVNSTFNVDEGSLYIGSVISSDIDGDNLTYSLSGTDASYFNINTNTNTLAFKTTPDYETQKHTYHIRLNVNTGFTLHKELY